MLAAVYCGKEDIRVENVPVPELANGEILLRVQYGGICGGDMMLYAGKHPRAQAPLVPGHEIVGRVSAIAGEAPGWKKGMRAVVYPLITCGHCAPCREGNAHVCETLRVVGFDRDGGFAEFVKVDPDKLVAIPDTVTDDEAALIEPLAVAVHAVENSSLRIGDTVLVTGAGPIGNLVAQVARAAGARHVVVSEVQPYRRQVAARMGFPTFNPTEEQGQQALQRLLGARFVDSVFEATGCAPAYKDAVECCKVRGQINFVGIPKTPPAVDVLQILFKEIFATSARVYRKRDYLAAISLLSRKAVDVLPLIERVPLNEAPAGFEKMKAASTSLKILLVP
jgi:(R,R)-butanediol dehydrogenase/meso-butanediol dehydrogenase/diacetyl reductase